MSEVHRTLAASVFRMPRSRGLNCFDPSIKFTQPRTAGARKSARIIRNKKLCP
jgi:hypothetical protein